MAAFWFYGCGKAVSVPASICHCFPGLALAPAVWKLYYFIPPHLFPQATPTVLGLANSILLVFDQFSGESKIPGPLQT